jgi:hypothetical protein
MCTHKSLHLLELYHYFFSDLTNMKMFKVYTLPFQTVLLFLN